MKAYQCDLYKLHLHKSLSIRGKGGMWKILGELHNPCAFRRRISRRQRSINDCRNLTANLLTMGGGGYKKITEPYGRIR